MKNSEYERVLKEPCHCVPCSSCGGTGTVWFAFPGADRGGRFLGNHRCDDLDDLELCEECNGGIVEVCPRCELLEDLDRCE